MTVVKKNFTSLGKIEIGNQSDFSRGKNGFQISPFLQEKMVYVGQLDCYDQSSELLRSLMNVEMSSCQIYRVTDTYGEKLREDNSAQVVLDYPSKQDTVYVEIDGSMVFTREEGWKETKLCRIFLGSDCLKADGEGRGMILRSHYLAHLGDKDTFIREVEQALEPYRISKASLVFISDGATWIRNWIDQSFDPEEAVSILDYYHAVEYLHEFADKTMKEEGPKRQWVARQKELLLQGQVGQVIDNIDERPAIRQAKGKVLTYYRANQDRMDYKRYKNTGVGIIGSGAIESAHRTVIQKRLKLSGQRWSKRGARNMLKLRTTKMNNRWHKVIELVQTEFKNTA